jgi:pimeloyl-ACP methyl ester carboxylesterase
MRAAAPGPARYARSEIFAPAEPAGFVPIETHRISTNGLTLNVQSTGSGPPVLLLHGFPDSSALWDEVTPHLVAAGYHVIAPDLRGFGDSDAPAGVRHYALAAIVTDLVTLLDNACPNARVNVVGHDWGSVAAWCLALAHPQRFAAGVAISVGHPREYALAGWEQKRKGLYTLAWQARGRAESRLSRDDFAGLRRWAWQHPRIDECVRRMSRPGRLTAGLNWYRANLARVLFGSWPKCAVPMLGIWSSDDDFLAEDQMQRSARRMNAPWEYVRIDRAGHWLPLEHPQTVARLAVDWFHRQEGGS